MPSQAQAAHAARRLRLWPGVAAAVLLVALRYVAPALAPDAEILGMPVSLLGLLGGVAAALVILLWWVLFSRAPWADRIGVIVLMAAALAGTYLVVHPSIANGAMGMLLPIYAVPLVALALVIGLVASRGSSAPTRRSSVAAAILVACGSLALIRTGGMTGDGKADLHWRWTPTPEERLLARAPSQPVRAASPAPAEAQADQAPVQEPPPAPAAPVAPDTASASAEPAGGMAGDPAAPPSTRPAPPVRWPGFRGAGRDAVVRDVRIATDWSEHPPVELWRRPVGPGWSSFAVRGDLVYTQEQRGDEELVSAYRLSTGEPVWSHGDPVRFWESNAGAGPRATPTVHEDRVYTLGATGILNALDAATGTVVWSRNAARDAEKEVPDWGIASSPVVVDDLVIVAIAGRLVAYDAATGQPRWFGPTGGGGYSSPHYAEIDGVPQVLLLRGSRTISVAPHDGTVLWDHTWQPLASILQPAFTDGGDVLITGGDGMGGVGMRRIAVERHADGWRVQERWTSRGLKPYFNDFVVHEGLAFGFDGSILAAIDLETGERRWKGGRYGHGQLLLLAEQDLLLVLAEEGDLALVAASGEGFREVSRVRALEGKTWNHPALIGDVLLVRNGEEMAAFRLSAAPRQTD